MHPLIQEIPTAHTPESLAANLRSGSGAVLLRTSSFDSPSARYSLVAANPFLTFRSSGSRCEISRPAAAHVNPQAPVAEPSLETPPFQNGGYVQFGNPWHLLDSL